MRYYPINLDVHDRNCLVVGGGAVATRKVKTLLECRAKVTVISPEITEALQDMARLGQIEIKKRTYQSQDLDRVFLVIGATDDQAVNRRIQKDARRLEKLCNIADQPEKCNFILPAIVTRGDLLITVSTAGKSPALAKKLRQRLEVQFGEEYGRLLRLMGAIRSDLLAEKHAPEAHKHLFERLLEEGLLEIIKARDRAAANALLKKVLGDGYEVDVDFGLTRRPESNGLSQPKGR
jgi:precorrin-2 dehydrogenase/sirohydrochlorin ferrochelatase